MPEGEAFLVSVWIANGLVRNIPVYGLNYKDYNHSDKQLYAPLPLSEELYRPVLENACAAEAERLEGILKKSCSAARSEYDRNRIKYLVSLMEGIKGKNIQP